MVGKFDPTDVAGDQRLVEADLTDLWTDLPGVSDLGEVQHLAGPAVVLYKTRHLESLDVRLERVGGLLEDYIILISSQTTLILFYNN